MVYLVAISCIFEASEAILSKAIFKMIKKVNKSGPYIGLLVPSIAELQPLFQSPCFKHSDSFTHLDFADFGFIFEGRRFHIGSIEEKKVIIAHTGKGMMNAAIAAQMLSNLFDVKSILHYGLAANANENLNIGDIVIPQFWAHTGLWNWQKYGDGPDDELPLEEYGDFTRDYGHLNFADYTNKTDVDEYSADNFLNSIWYQPEEIFHADGDPESKDTTFWVPIANAFFQFAKNLEASIP
ncbi:hypothetical protein HHK36_014135 [Tetracentron sinense]|uniref:Nucleoside phosphorylase domain-containing protein n=1 Tax=Tetracentron sinense TaxID=13715 RepID=A0A835DDZ2_TETSI|nr:hypothetical protein HHK36_014135 [Tetracentron sinense]